MMNQEEIKKLVSKYLSEGKKLAEIQDILKKEHDVSLTFMDLRLLASEIENFDWNTLNDDKDKDKDKKDLPEKEVVLEPKEETSFTGTKVEINKIARPGAVMSGTVKFASGAEAEWMLDQLGRIALEKKSGEPTQKDLQEFQMKLQKALGGGL